MDNYAEAVAQVDKNESKIKTVTVTLLVNIFLTVGMIINILDNDLIRDIINGEYKYQRSTAISATNAIYSFVVLVASNIYYFIQ